MKVPQIRIFSLGGVISYRNRRARTAAAIQQAVGGIRILDADISRDARWTKLLRQTTVK